MIKVLMLANEHLARQIEKLQPLVQAEKRLKVEEANVRFRKRAGELTRVTALELITEIVTFPFVDHDARDAQEDRERGQVLAEFNQDLKLALSGDLRLELNQLEDQLASNQKKIEEFRRELSREEARQPIAR